MVPTELPVTEDMGLGEDSAHVGISATPGFSSEVADTEANTNYLHCVPPDFLPRRLCEHEKISNVYLGVFFYLTMVSAIHRVPTALGWVKEASWPSALTQQGLSKLPFLSLA